MSLAELADQLRLSTERLGALVRRHQLMPNHRKGARYRLTPDDVHRIAGHPRIISAALRAASPAEPARPRQPIVTQPRDASRVQRAASPAEPTRPPQPIAAQPHTIPAPHRVPRPAAPKHPTRAIAARSKTASAAQRAASTEPIHKPALRLVPHSLIVPASTIAVTAAGLVLWAVALSDVDMGRMTDAGLVSVLPAQVFVALGLITAGFLITLLLRPSGPLLLLSVVSIILVLFGTTSIVEAVPHISATWRHAGIVDYIQRTHQVNPRIDAYFDWPGFFVFSAFLADVAGVKSVIGFARWAPLLYDLLFLLPVYLIARASVSDRRLIWTTVWFFSITNWVAQDYFSPQATTYFLYLVAVALLLSWMTVAGWRPVPDGFGMVRGVLGRAVETLRLGRVTSRGTPLQRMAVQLLVVALIAATVPSHQLTPFAFLAATTGLMLVGAYNCRSLPLVVLVMVASWTIFMASAYLAGHFGAVASSVGAVDRNVSSSLGVRLHGSWDHLLVVYTRLVLTGGLWALALIGFLRRFRSGRRDLPLVALAVAPFLLIALQSYGGEILLRIYLFVLPFAAFFAAAAFFPRSRNRISGRTSLALTLTSVALVAGFLVSRYGNERTDYFTKNEIAAARYVNRVAPEGALIVSFSRDYPRKFVRYEQLRYSFLGELPGWKRLTRAGVPSTRAVQFTRRAMTMGSSARRSYLIITQSQLADLETFSDTRPQWLEHLVTDLKGSATFRTLYANRDAVILQLRGGPA
jgi:hypothetical protein